MLDNPKINIRIKLAALWTSLMFLYIYGDYFELYVPHKVENLLNGSNLLDSPAKLFLAALLIAIPALLIAGNIFIKPKVIRFLNIFFGSLLTVIVILVGSISLYTWYSFYVFYAALEAIITIFIVYHAWKWPKENEA